MADTATRENVEQTIFNEIAKLGPERDQVTRDATFEALDIDSLDLVEVAQVIEEEFGVEIKGEDAQEFETVGDAVDFVVARTS
jgi:acyl carrier protein